MGPQEQHQRRQRERTPQHPVLPCVGPRKKKREGKHRHVRQRVLQLRQSMKPPDDVRGPQALAGVSAVQLGVAAAAKPTPLEV